MKGAVTPLVLTPFVPFREPHLCQHLKIRLRPRRRVPAEVRDRDRGETRARRDDPATSGEEGRHQQGREARGQAPAAQRHHGLRARRPVSIGATPFLSRSGRGSWSTLCCQPPSGAGVECASESLEVLGRDLQGGLRHGAELPALQPLVAMSRRVFLMGPPPRRGGPLDRKPEEPRQEAAGGRPTSQSRPAAGAWRPTTASGRAGTGRRGAPPAAPSGRGTACRGSTRVPATAARAPTPARPPRSRGRPSRSRGRP